MEQVKNIIPAKDIVDFYRPYIHLTNEELAQLRFLANLLNEMVSANPNADKILKLTAAFVVRDAYLELSYRN